MVIDDEPIARQLLENYIAKTDGLSLVKSCRNPAEAYEALITHEADLLFLDIEMPVLNGIEFYRSLKNPPLVVFVTAYPQHAVDGFSLNAVDYLLKPVTYERFSDAIAKVQQRMLMEIAETDTPHPPKADYIFIRQDIRLVRVNFADIDYIEAERDFSWVITGEKKMLAGMHLKLFETALDENRFMRVHRSYIVQLDRILAIKGNVIELGKKEIPIGASFRDQLLKRLKI
jgi:DNA-binding LytR/AlgR family response regulator